jgi:hypothetical protein
MQIKCNEKMKIFQQTQLGKPLSYFNWEESVKRTVYGLANTLDGVDGAL